MSPHQADTVVVLRLALTDALDRYLVVESLSTREWALDVRVPGRGGNSVRGPAVDSETAIVHRSVSSSRRRAHTVDTPMAKPRMDLSASVGKLLEEQDGDVLREGIRVLSP
jgi:hypothetical protein